jgi:hypothetical protein
VGQPSVQVTAVRVEAGRAPDVTRSVFVYSDESGQWAFNGLRAGRYLVGLNVFGPPTPRSPWPATWYPGVARAADAQVLDVTDAVAAPIEFRMPAALASQTIEGTVVDSTGRPVTGANVNLYDRADKRQSASHATTDTSGRFTIARLPGRQYDIEALLVIWGGPSPRTRRRLPDATDTRPVRIVLPGVVDRTKSAAGAGG